VVVLQVSWKETEEAGSKSLTSLEGERELTILHRDMQAKIRKKRGKMDLDITSSISG